LGLQDAAFQPKSLIFGLKARSDPQIEPVLPVPGPVKAGLIREPETESN
jgi:hypothetical protein